MRNRRIAACFVLSLLAAAPAVAQARSAFPAPVEGDYTARDFKFGTGETLPALKLHYRTVGTPQRDAAGVVRNAVLILHGTGGTGQGFLSPDVWRRAVRRRPASRRHPVFHRAA